MAFVPSDLIANFLSSSFDDPSTTPFGPIYLEPIPPDGTRKPNLSGCAGVSEHDRGVDGATY